MKACSNPWKTFSEHLKPSPCIYKTLLNPSSAFFYPSQSVFETLLGGSWDLVSKLITASLNGVTSNLVTAFKALVTKSHDPLRDNLFPP